MRFNKISILVVGILVVSLIFSCKKKDEDSNLLLLGAAVVAANSEQAAAEAAGGFSDVPQECDRTNLDCLKSLIGGKTWYSVGNTQIPRNLWGFKNTSQNCYTKMGLNIDTSLVSSFIVYSTFVQNTQSCSGNETSSPLFSDKPFNITPVTQYCFNVDINIVDNQVGFQGRGWVKGDGTELRLELYISGNSSFGLLTPAGHRCGDGPLGSKNSLTPDSEGCNIVNNNNVDFLVCNPASDPDYKNVQIFDLTQ